MFPNLLACDVMISLLPGLLQKKELKRRGISLIFLKIIQPYWQMTIPYTKTKSPTSLTPERGCGPYR